MLKYETPAVFDLIIELAPVSRKRSPPAKMIAIVCNASGDPSFVKPKFQRYLNEYIRRGVYCKRGKILSPEREQYYERLRRNKLRKYIDRHRDEIEMLRCAVRATPQKLLAVL